LPNDVIVDINGHASSTDMLEASAQETTLELKVIKG